jgi:hypothetical protein
MDFTMTRIRGEAEFAKKMGIFGAGHSFHRRARRDTITVANDKTKSNESKGIDSVSSIIGD